MPSRSAPRDDRIGIRTIALIGLGWAHTWNRDVEGAIMALDEAERAAASGARWFDSVRDHWSGVDSRDRR